MRLRLLFSSSSSSSRRKRRRRRSRSLQEEEELAVVAAAANSGLSVSCEWNGTHFVFATTTNNICKVFDASSACNCGEDLGLLYWFWMSSFPLTQIHEVTQSLEHLGRQQNNPASTSSCRPWAKKERRNRRVFSVIFERSGSFSSASRRKLWLWRDQKSNPCCRKKEWQWEETICEGRGNKRGLSEHGKCSLFCCLAVAKTFWLLLHGNRFKDLMPWRWVAQAFSSHGDDGGGELGLIRV